MAREGEPLAENTYTIKIEDATQPQKLPPPVRSEFHNREFNGLSAGDATADQRAAARRTGDDALTSRVIALARADWQKALDEQTKRKQDEIKLQAREMQLARDTWRKGIAEQQARQSDEIFETARQGRLTSVQQTRVGGFFQGIGQRSEALDEWRAANSTMLRGVTTFASTLATAGQLVADTLSVVAFRINKSIEIGALRGTDQQERAAMAVNEKNAGTAKAFNARSGAIGGAGIGTAIAPGPGTVIGAIAGGVFGGINEQIQDVVNDIRNSAKKEFLQQQETLRNRGQQLAGFNQPLARQFAIGEVQQQRRDIGEAAIIGGRLAEVEARQQQLDILNQQLGIVERIRQVQDQRKKLDTEIGERQKSLDESLKNVDANTAAMVRKLSEMGESPFDALKKAGGFKTGTGTAGGGVDLSRDPLGIPRVEAVGRPLLKGR